MNGTSLLSHVSNIDWSAGFHWYIKHLDAGYLLLAWEQGKAFTQDDWLSFSVLWGHVFILFVLVYLLVKARRETQFFAWISSRRSQMNNRPQTESLTRLEPKFTGLLKKAYNLHRLAMYEPALNNYRQALQSSPNDLNTYLAGIRIVSEMDVPNKAFVQFLMDGISQLREKHPKVWNEVAKYGRERAPSLDQWQPAS
ncbi:MAG TPA: hypothetical protein VKA31_09130 [Mariprofundaceae bacterium]|nr:hypothetical protein [Mariprofundaceae bacterium]